MTPAASPEAYRALLERLDRWFADARASRPGVVPCTGGCSACCHGPFDISVADAELVAAAVRALPDAERAEARAAAGALLARLEERMPGWQAPHDIADAGEKAFDAAGEALAAEPCPLLGPGGACRIYADRPLVCRMIGLSMLTPSGRVIENACPIQDRFPEYAALPPLLFDLEGLEEEEHASLDGAARRLFGDPARRGYETTIAAAVVNFAW